ncbi:MAG: type II toxin-antitoxin system antitoxin SocA domain-containing protein [Sulfitobacter sp.]
MKLQKLVYCSYGWWLAVNNDGHPRLTTEGPEIWKHGPVFDSLYHTFKTFGRKPILSPQSSNPFEIAENVDADDEHVRNFISWVWGRYGHLSSFSLSDMTHKPGTPWHRVASENNFRVSFSTEIPDQYIVEEFRKLLNAAQVAASNQAAQNAETQRQQA